MKVIGIILSAIGALGFFIGGSGIDGSTEIACWVLALVSLLVWVLGNKLYTD